MILSQHVKAKILERRVPRVVDLSVSEFISRIRINSFKKSHHLKKKVKKITEEDCFCLKFFKMFVLLSSNFT